ncbi:hypothetical protein [Lysobacter sp. CA199]|uniref:hypothetical protein n=1 Tax=Lysobacter sp. CA199 TaxID=3455608 RepID=UPI003F8D4A3B
MKAVAAVLLALMLSACNPELIDYSSARFDRIGADGMDTRVPGAAASPLPAGTCGKVLEASGGRTETRRG